jgi:hypothetical protein
MASQAQPRASDEPDAVQRSCWLASQRGGGAGINKSEPAPGAIGASTVGAGVFGAGVFDKELAGARAGSLLRGWLSPGLPSALSSARSSARAPQPSALPASTTPRKSRAARCCNIAGA